MPGDEKKTRMEIYKDIGYEPKFPAIEHFEHLINYLNELGIAVSGMSGPTSISWTEIASWKELTHTCLETWEARVVMRLSKEYCSYLDTAKDTHCKAPYTCDDEDDLTPVRKIVDSKIRGLLNGR